MILEQDTIRIFLCGDVMTGRGIDQILAHPGKPELYEAFVKDAGDYVKLAEQKNGAIPRKVEPDYIWGDALKEWKREKPHLRLMNLETSVTQHDTPWKEKGIHYRMHPDNIQTLVKSGTDVCALANNHIMDWAQLGLMETLSTLDQVHIKHTGAGKNLKDAQTPAIHALNDQQRILVFSLGITNSGIPQSWRAEKGQAGVWLLNDFSAESVNEVQNVIDSYRQPGDFCILSIHWGQNWGYDVPVSHQTFAHELIDGIGINVIHGHSSHHPVGIEVYKNTPILYGCGDFINDYEGISGYEAFKDYLTFMYFLEFDAKDWHLNRIELTPMEIKQFKLQYASKDDAYWLLKKLNDISRPFLTTFKIGDPHTHSLKVVVDE